MTLHHGDCLDVMATFDAESIDAIVTDPPYGLEFMGKEWDKLIDSREQRDHKRPDNKGQTASPYIAAKVTYVAGAQAQDWHQRWAEAAFRVAKPGAHLLAFGGTRTVHRMTAALEDAGWEIRDMLVWAYASGFPKSHNLTGEWDGWGTALKPAWEPIVLARKPLRGTVAANVLRHGTGALNIDGTRIGTAGGTARATNPKHQGRGDMADFTRGNFGVEDIGAGRWPANVILTNPIFDGGVEGVVGGGEQSSQQTRTAQRNAVGESMFGNARRGDDYLGDSGTYSRFFLIPKSARAEREPVLGGPTSGDRAYGAGKGVKTRECRVCGDRTQSTTKPYQPACQHGDWEWKDALPIARANIHPTVKPLDLMRHLVRLVTPPGGTVLDPFLGSGTTALAAEMEGFAWVGIEREAEYVAIAEARLNGTQRGLGLTG